MTATLSGGETPTSPTVGPLLAYQTSQSFGRLALGPSPHGPECQLVLMCQLSQLDLRFQEGLQHAEALHGLGSLLFRQRAQWRDHGMGLRVS
jgi:hypothetical protein